MSTKLKATEDEEMGLLKKQKSQRDYERQKYKSRQEFADKLILYLTSAFWVAVGAVTVYYTNFFHHLFRNPNINQLFFQISMAGYTIIFSLMIFSSFIMPRISEAKNIEEYNPKLVSIGAVVGLIAVISLLVAIWPVWGWWSFLIFLFLWKGFFSLAIFIPGGTIGNIFFLSIITAVMLSFYIIEHEGYLH